MSSLVCNLFDIHKLFLPELTLLTSLNDRSLFKKKCHRNFQYQLSHWQNALIGCSLSNRLYTCDYTRVNHIRRFDCSYVIIEKVRRLSSFIHFVESFRRKTISAQKANSHFFFIDVRVLFNLLLSDNWSCFDSEVIATFNWILMKAIQFNNNAVKWTVSTAQELQLPLHYQNLFEWISNLIFFQLKIFFVLVHTHTYTHLRRLDFLPFLLSGKTDENCAAIVRYISS